jgi:hypothetical protein
MSDIGSEVINSNETDKELGMAFCERFLRLQGKDVRTIFWQKQDEEGHHHFFLLQLLLLILK